MFERFCSASLPFWPGRPGNPGNPGKPGGPKGPERPGGPLFPIDTKKHILRFNPNKLDKFIASIEAGEYLEIHKDLVVQKDQKDQAVPVDLDVQDSLGLLDLQIQLWQEDSTLYTVFYLNKVLIFIPDEFFQRKITHLDILEKRGDTV